MIVNFSCGHTKQVHVDSRDRKRMRENPGLCPDCIKANIEAANAASKAEAEAKGWPELKGTPKQVAWANTIRSDMIKMVEQEARNERDKERCINYLLTITDASFLIDARSARIEDIRNSARMAERGMQK